MVDTPNRKQRAVVLLSGGLDSATTLAIAKDQGSDLYVLTVDYGQRHKVELEAANKVARYFDAVEHKFVNLDLSTFGGSALTSEIPVPKSTEEGRNIDRIPETYVPARNTIMLSIALAYAETIGAGHIFIGVNSVDYSGYPDCRPEFIRSFQELVKLATKAGVEGSHIQIETPLISMTKAEIIQTGIKLGVDYSITHSCYDPDSKDLACGMCDSCRIRKHGFKQAGVNDPTLYSPDNG